MPYDYQRLGLDSRLRKTDSVAGRPRPYVTALDMSYQQEPTPFTPRTQVSKGTVQSTDGGVVEWFDTTGGTKLLSYNPDTGEITINGAVIANVTLTVGTISGGVLGTATIVGGTANNVVIGTPSITGGTGNAMVLGSPAIINGTANNMTLGTPAVTGGTATSFVINASTLGTPGITGGTMNNGVFGTPHQTGGTHNSAVFGTPTLQTPTITSGTFTNKLNMATGANQSVGKGTLAAGSTTVTTTAVTANSFIFLTPLTGNANLGILSVGTINAGTDFLVRSSNILDDDVFNYWLIN